MATYNKSIPRGSALIETIYAPSVTLASTTNPYSAIHNDSVGDSDPQPLDLPVYRKGFIEKGDSKMLHLVVSWEGSLEDGFAIGCHIGAGKNCKEEHATDTFSKAIRKILRDEGSEEIIKKSCRLASLVFVKPRKQGVRYSPWSIAASDVATTIKALYKWTEHPELKTQPVFRGYGGALVAASPDPAMSQLLDNATRSGSLQDQSTSMNEDTTLFRYAKQNSFLEGHMREVSSSRDYALYSLPCPLKWRHGGVDITIIKGDPDAEAKNEKSTAERGTNTNRLGYQPNKVSSRPTSSLTSAHSGQVATPAPQGHQMSDIATSTQISDDANTFGGPLRASPLDAPAGSDTNVTGHSASLFNAQLHSRTPSFYEYDLDANQSCPLPYGNSPNFSTSAKDQCSPISENWGPEQVDEYVRQVALMGEFSTLDQRQSLRSSISDVPDTQASPAGGCWTMEMMPAAMGDDESEQEIQDCYEQRALPTGVGGPADLYGQKSQASLSEESADLAIWRSAPTAVPERPIYMQSVPSLYQHPQTADPYDDFVTRAIPLEPTRQYFDTPENRRIGSTSFEESAALTPNMYAASRTWQNYATAQAAPDHGQNSLLSPDTVTHQPFIMQGNASFVSSTLNATVYPTVHPDGSMFLQPPQSPTTCYDPGSFDDASALAYGHSPPLNRHPSEQNQPLLPTYPDTVYPSLQDQEATTSDPSSQTPPLVFQASHALMTPLARAHLSEWPDGKGKLGSTPRRPRGITGESGRKDWERRDG